MSGKVRQWRMSRTALLLLLAATGPGMAAPAPTPAPTPPAPAADTIQPDRPGIADGSLVIGPRRFQVEIGLQQEFRSSSHQDEQRLFLPTLLRFGVDSRWEARIESNTLTYTRTSESGAGVHRTFGYSPVSAGAKYHFQDAKERTGNLSLGAILRLFPPSGSSDFRTHHLNGDFRLAADWGLAPDWALNPNVGVAVYEDDAGKLFPAGLAAVTLTYGPNNRIQPFVDVGLQSPEQTAGRTALIFDGGGTYLLNPDTQLDLSLGTGLAGRTPPHLFWTAGISRRF
jgi:hypothetical protein